LEVKWLGHVVDHHHPPPTPTPKPSSAKVKERVELYFYSPSGPSWKVAR